MLKWLSQQKTKIMLLVFAVIVFTVLLFPFQDLSDLVTTKVSELTQGQIYVQFEDLQLSLLPVGVELQEVLLETPQIQGLKIDQLVFSPSVSSLIFQRPAGSLQAEGVLGAQVSASIAPGKKTEDGQQMQRVELNIEKLKLNRIQDIFPLPISLRGQIAAQADAQVDLTFQAQPDVELNIKIEQFELPPSSVETALGPVVLPEIKLSQVELVGRLSNGRFDISKATLGKSTDELSGEIKGNLGVTFVPVGGQVAPRFSNYNFNIDLNIKSSLENRATLFLALLQSYKSPVSGGHQYKFKVSGQNFFAPPSITSP